MAMMSVKMRASLEGRHISGAERIVADGDSAKTASILASRAMAHPKGPPDFVGIKIEKVADFETVAALPVRTHSVSSPEEGWKLVSELLGGFSRIREIVAMFPETDGMRGAMLLDADTLERLEPNRERGVRATCMDAKDSSGACAGTKNHYAEAIVLATKVQNAPGIVAEICVSDDPGYVTGYVASKELGYRRITKLKEPGDPHGGRIFLYRGRREDVPKTVEYLEKRCVLVEGVPVLDAPSRESRYEGMERELEEVRAAGLWRDVSPVPEGMDDFSSNDYLGLARHPKVREAAAQAAQLYGGGARASRLVTGTLPVHEEFERRIAAFKGYPAAISFATGYMANAGTVAAIAGKGDVIVSDRLNHASIIDGCRLSGADVAVYGHLDMDDLARTLSRCGGYRRRLVVSDGVFSMDGDMLPLDEFVRICSRYDAFSMVDEAHATGVLGKTGRGLCECFPGVKPDISMGTTSKALGSQGGYVCADWRIVQYLRQKSRPFIFSTAPCPASSAAALAALDVLENTPELVSRLRENVSLLVTELSASGIRVRTDSAIVPVPVGDETLASKISDALLASGFLAKAIRYPTVPRGKAIIRLSVTAEHKTGSIRRLSAELSAVLGRFLAI